MRLPRRALDAYNAAVKQCGDGAERASLRALSVWLEAHPDAEISEVREFCKTLLHTVGTSYGQSAGDAAYALRSLVADGLDIELPDVDYAYEPDPEYVDKTARYQMEKLKAGDPDGFGKAISDAARYFAERGANDTMTNLGEHDAKKLGKRVSFARVPTGPTTCPYCLMLASRGFVYSSELKALNANHRNCDCRIVEGFPGMTVEGYDPDLYYDMWKHPEKYENENPQGQPAFEFTPAKDIKQAREYARANFDCDADFTGLDIRAVNEMNKSIAAHIDMFPELKDNIGFIGSAQACNTRRKNAWEEYYYNKNFDTYERLGKDEDFKRRQAKRAAARTVGKSHGEWAWSYSPEQSYPDSHLRGICMNKSMWTPKAYDEQIKSLKHSVETKFHPEGCDTVKSIFDHEIGHQLDSLLSIRSDSEFVAYHRRLTRENVKDGLSEYAAKNEAEFIAEAWSEYQNNQNPREHAEFVGELIMRKYEGGGWR